MKKIMLLLTMMFFITTIIFAQDNKKYEKLQKKATTNSGGLGNAIIAKGSVSGTIIFTTSGSVLNGFGLLPNNIKVFEVSEVGNANNIFSIKPIALGRWVKEAIIQKGESYSYDSDSLCNYTINNLPLNKKFVLVYQRYTYDGMDGDPTQNDITNAAKKYNLNGAFFDFTTIYNDSKSIMMCSNQKSEILNNITCKKITDIKIH